MFKFARAPHSNEKKIFYHMIFTTLPRDDFPLSKLSFIILLAFVDFS